MTGTPDEIDLESVRDWLKRDVATGIEDLRESEIEAPHTQEWYRGVLAWFAKYYIDDAPESLSFADGPGDGGIDVALITESDDQTHVEIFQFSVPKLESIAAGRVSTGKAKFADDVRKVHNTIVGHSKKLRRLNATAQEVMRQINRARELSRESDGSERPIMFEIRSLTLRQAHPDAVREMEELAKEANEEWSSPGETWIVHPVRDVKSLYAHYQRKRGKDESPSELRIGISGNMSADHAERGPYLCFIKAIDLVREYQKWGAGLLDANLRYSLGKTEVNKVLENELSRVSSIKWFHEKNNGIVIVCNQCSARKGKVRLVAPQVVNGGQTIHSIAKVIEELEETPLDKRTKNQKELLDEINKNLKLSARIVTISGGTPTRPDEIAIASNTQNKLSERTMMSPSLDMRDLRLSLAALESPWFVVTKDGEWAAISKNTRLFQSKTGNRRPKEFRRHRRDCRIENTELGIALLAFMGFVEEAKPSRVFKRRYFAALFGSMPKESAWDVLSTRRLEWKGDAFIDAFADGQAPASLWLVSYFVWLFWKSNTYPESKQFLIAYEEEGKRNSVFLEKYKKTSGWDVTDGAKADLLKRNDCCYWVEQVAKSAYLVLTYQSMRVLNRCFGKLDDETCRRILDLPQFKELYEGRLIGTLGDFRNGSLSDGPLTAIGRVLHYSCEMLWQANETRIRQMASRQQVLLQEDWIARLSQQVDIVCDKVTIPSFRHASGLEGPDDSTLEVSSIQDVIGSLVATV